MGILLSNDSGWTVSLAWMAIRSRCELPLRSDRGDACSMKRVVGSGEDYPSRCQSQHINTWTGSHFGVIRLISTLC